MHASSDTEALYVSTGHGLGVTRKYVYNVELDLRCVEPAEKHVAVKPAIAFV
jgi:hypothetical protein